jgi:CMP-N-acetylneuraminic acid synthetase
VKNLAIIPARGGSKRVPQKNIRMLHGKPLIAYTIESALAACSIDRLVVSTEDQTIAEIAKKAGAEVPCMRPPELATDEALGVDVLRHMVRFLEESESFYPDFVLTLQPTSPLRQPRHIDEAVELFRSDPGADSLVSVVDMRGFAHTYLPYCVMSYGPDRKHLQYFLDERTRQDCIRRHETIYARNSAIYITRRSRLDEYAYGGTILGYIMEPEYSIDIDTEYDFLLAALLMKHHTEQGRDTTRSAL